jgi:hypothetical protein
VTAISLDESASQYEPELRTFVPVSYQTFRFSQTHRPGLESK